MTASSFMDRTYAPNQPAQLYTMMVCRAFVAGSTDVSAARASKSAAPNLALAPALDGAGDFTAPPVAAMHLPGCWLSQ
jgi:hypothetical protein